MKTSFCVLVLSSLLLTACGGGGGSGIISSAQASDAGAPIPSNFIERRIADYTGGARGYVYANRWSITDVGPNVTSFEWNLVAQLNNRASAGENVAFYAQANAQSSGPTWAAVSEVCDETFGAEAPTMVAHEFDAWVSGYPNKDRLGIHITVGDSRQVRNAGKSTEAIGSEAIRINATHSNASWQKGITMSAVTDIGIEFQQVPTYLIAIPGSAINPAPLGKYVGKMPMKLGDRTVYIPVYE